jgi:hypothetical protein
LKLYDTTKTDTFQFNHFLMLSAYFFRMAVRVERQIGSDWWRPSLTVVGAITAALGAALLVRRQWTYGVGLAAGGGLLALAGCSWRRREVGSELDQLLAQRVQAGWGNESAQYHQETLRRMVELGLGEGGGETADQLMGRMEELNERRWRQEEVARQQQHAGQGESYEQRVDQLLIAAQEGHRPNLEAMQELFQIDRDVTVAQVLKAGRLQELAIRMRLDTVRQAREEHRLAILWREVQAFQESVSQNRDSGQLSLIQQGLSLCTQQQEWTEQTDVYQLVRLGFQLALRVARQNRQSPAVDLTRLQDLANQRIIWVPTRGVGVALCRAVLRLDPDQPLTEAQWLAAANEELAQLAFRLGDYQLQSGFEGQVGRHTSAGVHPPTDRLLGRQMQWPYIDDLIALHQRPGLPQSVKRRIGWLLRCVPNLGTYRWKSQLEPDQTESGERLPEATQFVRSEQLLAVVLGEGGPPARYGPWNLPEVQEFLGLYARPLSCIFAGFLDRATIVRAFPELAAARGQREVESETFDQRLDRLLAEPQLDAIRELLQLDRDVTEAQRLKMERLQELAIRTRLDAVRQAPEDDRLVILSVQVQAFQESVGRNPDSGRLRLIQQGLPLCGHQEWSEQGDLYRLVRLGYQLALRVAQQRRTSPTEDFGLLHRLANERLSGANSEVGMRVALCRALVRLDPAQTLTEEQWLIAAKEELGQLASWFHIYKIGIPIYERAEHQWPGIEELVALHQRPGLPQSVKRRIGWLLRCIPSIRYCEWKRHLEPDQNASGERESEVYELVSPEQFLAVVLGEGGPPVPRVGPWRSREFALFVTLYEDCFACFTAGFLDRATILEACPVLATARAN